MLIFKYKEEHPSKKQKGVFKDEAFCNSDHINLYEKENECQTEAIQILSKESQVNPQKARLVYNGTHLRKE